MPEPVSIQVGGNVAGSIVLGEHNFVVNSDHGTVVYQQAGPQVQARQFTPQPPRPPRGFVNRTAELAQLETWIAANETVLLHGPDGMGKSALLKQASNSAAAKAMPHGVIVLEGVDPDGQVLGPDDVIQRLFNALFESNPPLKVDAVSARTYLSNTRPLILMDEVGLSPALQKALPDLFPKGSLLLTADVPFGADFQRMAVKPLPRAESVALLVTKAEWVVTDANRPTLDKICALLDDVSLALVITGNVLRETHLHPEAALEAIGQIPVPDRDPTQAALNRAFTFAFGRLSLGEQKVLSAAALTPGISMTPEWLSAALGGLQVEAFIERLKTLGLLFANSPRLRLPPGFRAAAQRASVLEKDTLMLRLIEFLRAPLQTNPQNWEYIQDELGNFFGALTWAAQTGRAADVVALGRALDPYLTLHGLWDAWRTVIGQVLDAARQSGAHAAEAWALHQSGVRAIGVGTRREALHFLRQALDLRRTLGDTVGMAYTQHNIDLLIGPPAPPHDTLPSQPAKPPEKGPDLFLLFVGIGVVGILALVTFLVIVWSFFTPISRPTSTPTITPTLTETPILTVTPTLTLTETSTPTLTPIFTLTASPTPTLLPTPLGGSEEIVFQSGSDLFSMYLVNVDGSGLRELLNNSSVAPEPAWSPDGQYLAFLSNDLIPGAINISHTTQNQISSQIYIVDADGSNIRQLTQGSGNRSHPTWSPDGKQIAFVSGNPTQGSDIYSIDINGENLDDLTNSDGVGHYNYPEWSPDGSRIAYQAQVDTNWELFSMNTDGSDPIQLTNMPQGQSVSSIHAAWSPNSKRIVFASDRTSVWDIYVMNRDGSGVQQLTHDKFQDITPDWSPDGGLITFSSNHGKNLQIYIMAKDGSGVRQLISIPGNIYPLEPDWRPAQIKP
jgi:Tol biopolymer transport system component